jgi:hypothetical protein
LVVFLRDPQGAAQADDGDAGRIGEAQGLVPAQLHPAGIETDLHDAFAVRKRRAET